jgi:hypothetical protein
VEYKTQLLVRIFYFPPLSRIKKTPSKEEYSPDFSRYSAPAHGIFFLITVLMFSGTVQRKKRIKRPVLAVNYGRSTLRNRNSGGLQNTTPNTGIIQSKILLRITK